MTTERSGGPMAATVDKVEHFNRVRDKVAILKGTYYSDLVILDAAIRRAAENAATRLEEYVPENISNADIIERHMRQELGL